MATLLAVATGRHIDPRRRDEEALALGGEGTGAADENVALHTRPLPSPGMFSTVACTEYVQGRRGKFC